MGIVFHRAGTFQIVRNSACAVIINHLILNSDILTPAKFPVHTYWICRV